MATKFQIKRTSVSGRTPNTADPANSSYIAAGELAVNLTDKKVFSSNGTIAFEVGANLSSITVSGNATINTIVANGSLGLSGQALLSNSSGGLYWGTAGGASEPTVITDTFTGNDTNTVFTLSTTTRSEKTFVFLNGVMQIPTTDYSVSNSTLTFVTPPANTDTITVRTFEIESLADVEFTTDTFTGNGSNTQFTLSTTFSSNTFSFVFLNGVAQVPGTDYGISGSTLTFTTAPPSAEAIRVTCINPIDEYAITTYTANGTTSVFGLPHPSSTKKTFVSLNGLTQSPVTDYNVVGNSLTFTNPPASNDTVIIRSIFVVEDAAGANTTIQYNKSGDLGGSLGFTFNDTTNNVVIGNTLTVPNFILNASNPPANSTASGATGTFAWDSSYFYIAVGTNTWKKVPITTDGSGGSGNANTAGNNTEVQFNDSGVLGASAGFVFDKDSNTVTVSNAVYVGANVFINTTAMFIGNSTANTTITPGNVNLQGSILTVGNSSSNTVITGEYIAATKIGIPGAGEPTFGNTGQILSANSTGGLEWGPGNGYGITRESFEGNGSNTQYTLSREPFNEEHTQVYVDRILQRNEDYNVSGSTLSFTTPPENQSTIDVYIMRSGLEPFRGVTRNAFTGNGSNTEFTLAASSSGVAYTLVFVDTVFQPTSEYTILGNKITFSEAPGSEIPIEVVQLGTGAVGDPQVAGSNNEIQYHSSNSFAANNKFTFNPTTTTVAVGSNLTINTSAIFIGNSTVNTTIVAGNVDLQGTQLRVGNVVVNGNQLVLGNVTITDAAITVGNSTVNTVLGSTGSLSGNGASLSSVNAIALEGNSVSDILVSANTLANTLANNYAANAYTNAASYADGVAATAYSNATSYADTIAGTAFSNAAARADSAYSNAASYADSKAATAYSNATSYADTKAGDAFSNAAARADSAYSNAVAYAASNTYVNNTFLPLAGGTATGAIIVSNTLSTGNTTINGFVNVTSNLTVSSVSNFGNDVTITGNLIVSGTRIFANTTTVDLSDNIITLNADIGAISPSENAGLEVNRGSAANVQFVWNETIDKWTFTTDGTNFVTVASNNDVSTAYSNAISYSGNAALAYSNATSYADTKAGEAYSNAISYSGNAALAYANATSYADSKAATAFSNAAARADSAYSNAIAYSANATNISSGTVAFARLPALYLGTTQIQSTSAAQAVSGITTLAAGNTTITGFANVTTTLQVGTNTATFGTAAYVVANGNVGIGTASPAVKLDVVGSAIKIFNNSTFARLDIGTTNNNYYLQVEDGTFDGIGFYQVSPATAGWKFIINTDGNVGIGNNAPAGKLVIGHNSANNGYQTVLSNPAIQIENSNAAGQSVIALSFGGTVRSTIRGDYDGNLILSPKNGAMYYGFDVSGANTVNHRFYSNSSTLAVLFAANGNVGIGTTTPTSKLHVEDGDLIIGDWSAYPGGGAASNAAGTPSKLRFGLVYNAAAYNPTIELFHRSDWSATMGILNDQFVYTSGHSHVFYTGANTSTVGTARFQVSGNGNIGIGTSSPSTKLHLYESGAADAIFRITPENGSYDALIQLTGQGNDLAEEGFEIWYDNNVGDVHLGTTFPNDAASIHFHTRTGASKSTSNERLTILGNGNIGIANTAPAVRLQIGSLSSVSTATPETVSLGGSYSSSAGSNAKLRLWTNGTNTMGLGVSSDQLDYILTGAYSHVFYSNGSERVRINSSGNITPGANGTQNFGSSTLRWATVYTSDLDLSNGIGDWTIVEGEDDLFIYNNKRGKVYKFKLEEVDPSTATPKKENL